ncbi:MAG: hypothetical protein J0652_06240 [Desulfobulbaceae bacterium]|nr:hypothetical protein [Desulfobulbaceae bacterium]
MESTNDDEKDISPEELEKMDADLLAIDFLIRSRGVRMPGNSNVTVREIEEKK